MQVLTGAVSAAGARYGVRHHTQCAGGLPYSMVLVCDTGSPSRYPLSGLILISGNRCFDRALTLDRNGPIFWRVMLLRLPEWARLCWEMKQVVCVCVRV